MTDRVKAKREWVGPHGIRMVELESGEECFDLDDLPRVLLAVDPDLCSPEARQVIERFRREAPMLPPAAQFRSAVQVLAELGTPLPEGFREPQLRAVKRWAVNR